MSQKDNTNQNLDWSTRQVQDAQKYIERKEQRS